MRRNRTSLLGEQGKTNHYHVVSRVVGRTLVFGDEEKEAFKKILDRQLNFSGLRCLAFCFMGNHFHLLLEVPDKGTAMRGWSDEDLLERLGTLSAEPYTRRVLADVAMWRENGNSEAVRKVAASVRSRLFDLSRFMQELKHRFSTWFNKRHGRKGTLWEERFKSVLVEGEGGATPQGVKGLLAVAAYIDLNPVRAGITNDPKDYRWCSYAAAVAGNREARRGLSRCACAGRHASWRRASRSYRVTLFGTGARQAGGRSPEGSTTKRAGFSSEEIDRVLNEGGDLPLPVLMRCRLRYLTEGLALGDETFLRAFLTRHRPKVPDSATHPIAGGDRLGLRYGGRKRRREVIAPG